MKEFIFMDSVKETWRDRRRKRERAVYGRSVIKFCSGHERKECVHGGTGVV